jgi:hypothetical protein
MPRTPNPPNLQSLLEQLATIAEQEDTVSIKQIRDAIGGRSFSPMLLFASLLGFTPVGVVPGVPTLLAIFVILVAGQIVFARPNLWAPVSILAIQVDGGKIKKAAIALAPFARLVDRVLRPRLSFLTEPPYSSALAGIFILIALAVPPLELVPLVDVPLWGAMVAFSLALFTHDGALAIVAGVLTIFGVYLVGSLVF